MKIRLPTVSGTYGVPGPSGEIIYGTPSDPVRPKFFDQFLELRECRLAYNIGAGTVEATAPSFPDELLNLPEVEILDDQVLTFEAAIEPVKPIEPIAPIVQPDSEPPDEVPDEDPPEVPDEGNGLEPDEKLPEDADLDEQPEEKTPKTPEEDN